MGKLTTRCSRRHPAAARRCVAAELGTLVNTGHMALEVTPAEYAQRVVDGFTRGIICPGEVWNQVSEHATEATLGEFVSRFTPELHTYFKNVVLVHSRPRSEKEVLILKSLREWYERHNC